ncbi:MAG: penicillin-binding protein 1A [Janthinobacterium lividum]
MSDSTSTSGDARERMVPGGQGPGGRRPRAPSPQRPRLGFVRKVAGALLGLTMLGGVVAGIVAWSVYSRFSADLPTLDGLRHYQPRVMSRVYSGDDRLMIEFATERRIFVPYAAIPDLVKQAFLSAEDQNFWSHRGVDPLAIARAAFTDLTRVGANRRPVGASTITQQVAKNMLVGNEVSLARKAREAILALRIEDTLSKERILELYLNEIYLGEKAYGVAAAAQVYFNKSLDQLDAAEAAMLAALPKAPNNYDPFRARDAAHTRRDWVLDRMVDTRAITASVAAAAKAEPLVPAGARRPDTVPGAEWFTDEVRRQLVERFGADQTAQGGLAVHTSLDPALQLAADAALREGLTGYDRVHGGWRGPVARLAGGRVGWPAALAAVPRTPGMLPGWVQAAVIEAGGDHATVGWLEGTGAAQQERSGVLALSELGWARPVRNGVPGAAPRRIGDVVQVGDVVMVEPARAGGEEAAGARARGERVGLRQIPQVQGALVSLDPTTGRVLALSGGWSYEASQFNRATQAQRQPGSSFKPFVYLTAMEQDISPSQRFLDAPFVQGEWRPNNYEMDFGGPTPLHTALVKSLNLVTVRLASRVGMDSVAETAMAFHEVESMPHVLPASLGAVDTTVLREAGAYASLDEGGREVLPSVIDSVQDRDGHVVWRAPVGLSCEACGDAGRMPVLTDGRRQVADAASTFQVVEMMRDVVEHGTGIPARKGLDRPIAGKTGTSQDFNDAWFAGFTPGMVTVVWVGFDTPASLGDDETGGAVAAPIWNHYMAAAMRGRPALEFRVPDGVTLQRWSSGNGSVIDAFKPGQVPGVSAGGGETVSASSSNDAARGPSVSGTGVDSGMGGLY